jgi:putative ubiquitin-RnfH superfamily antitoxin RatB of RatAB toxin-antitoxin module
VLKVEVVYALPRAHDAVTLNVAEGATVADAVRASGILERHPEIDLARNKLGLFGKVVAPATRLAPGDRVEIYRALAIDPKEVRRARARKKR